MIVVPLEHEDLHQLFVVQLGETGHYRKLHIACVYHNLVNTSLPKMQAESLVHTYSYITPSI